MDTQEIKEVIMQELPALLEQDEDLRKWVLDLIRSLPDDEPEIDSHFDQMLHTKD
jgi:tetrahydromethanopterin S-methyltransferase subunit B